MIVLAWSCLHTPLRCREGAKLLVLQPGPQHAGAGLPGCAHPHPHQWHIGPPVLLRLGDADVQAEWWGCMGVGSAGLGMSARVLGVPYLRGHPLSAPAPFQSAWRTRMSLRSTSSGWGLSLEALMELS